MRSYKYGFSAKVVAALVVGRHGVRCSERAALSALAAFHEDGLVFRNANLAASAIAEYHSKHGKFPRYEKRDTTVQRLALNPLDLSGGCTLPQAVAVLRRFGIQSITLFKNGEAK